MIYRRDPALSESKLGRRAHAPERLRAENLAFARISGESLRARNESRPAR